MEKSTPGTTPTAKKVIKKITVHASHDNIKNAVEYESGNEGLIFSYSEKNPGLLILNDTLPNGTSFPVARLFNYSIVKITYKD